MKNIGNEKTSTMIEKCKNCESELQGSFCHNCGQEKKDIHLSLKRLLQDSLESLFSFDSRFGRTLKILITKPGKITEEFLKGKRVRFIPPVKLYLFISVIFFLMLSINGPYGSKFKFNEGKPKNENGKYIHLGSGKAKQSEKQSEIKNVNEVKPENQNDKNIHLNSDQVEHPKAQSPIKKIEKENTLDPEWIELLKNKAERAAKNKKSFGQFLTKNYPKTMFFLLPIFALLLKLFFKKSNFYYIEHLIFSIHLHSFIFMLLTMQELIILSTHSFSTLISDITDAFFNICILIYIFKAIKYVYKFSWFSTILRGIITLFLYFIAFGITFIALIFISFLLF